MNLGLFGPDATDPYQRAYIGAISRHAAAAGHSLTVASTNVLHQPPEGVPPENQLLAFLDSRHFDGALLLADSIFHRVDAETALRVLSPLEPSPWLTIGKVPWSERSVSFENSAALQGLMRHLVDEHGHRDFLILRGPASSIDSEERWQTVLHFLRDRSGTCRWVLLTCDFLFEEAQRQVLQYYRSEPPFRPQAIVCLNDNMAVGALRALRTLGIDCPQDCAVTGFDDVEEAALEAPPLTTIRQPFDEIARVAVEQMGNPLRPLFQVEVPTQLIVRESCGCAASLGQKEPPAVLLRTLQRTRLRGESLLGTAAEWGARVNGALELSTLLQLLTEVCDSVPIPCLRLYLPVPESAVTAGLPERWNRVYSYPYETTPSLDTWADLSEVALAPAGPSEAVHTVTLLYAEGQTLGLLSCVLLQPWLSFARLLAAILSSGLGRVQRWQNLVNLNEGLEASVLQRNRELTGAIDALRQENRRRVELERQLEDERLTLERILEAQPNALVIVSEVDQRVTYYNRHFTQLIGWKAQTPRPPVDSFSHDYGRLLAGPSTLDDVSQKELNLPLWSGGRLPVLIRRTRLTLRGVPSVLAGMLDLTDRKQLERDLLDVREADSRRFGQELHDDVCQKLAALTLFTSTLDRKLADHLGERVPEVVELSVLTKSILNHVRGVSRGLFPIEVGQASLEQVIGRLLSPLGAQSGLDVVWNSNLEGQRTGLSVDDELHLFRIVQEAVQNTLKHAAAARLVVSLNREQSLLVLTVSDDGTGPDSDPVEGLGLRSMRYRASQLGAVFVWGANVPVGTRLSVSVPLPQERI